jgi:hypothetical protein
VSVGSRRERSAPLSLALAPPWGPMAAAAAALHADIDTLEAKIAQAEVRRQAAANDPWLQSGAPAYPAYPFEWWTRTAVGFGPSRLPALPADARQRRCMFAACRCFSLVAPDYPREW